MSNRELLATDYYRKSPHSEKQWVKARRQAGVDEMLSQQGMEQAISVTMTDVDIYQNNITLFTNKFVSPLSSLGPSFYKYYLMDTLTVAGKPCVDLTSCLSIPNRLVLQDICTSCWTAHISCAAW